MVVIALCFSILFKRAYYVFKLAAIFLIIVDITLEMLYGASLQELLLIISIEAFGYLATLRIKDKDTKEFE